MLTVPTADPLVNEIFRGVPKSHLEGFDEQFKAQVWKYLIGVLRRPNPIAMLAYQVFLVIRPLWAAVDENQRKSMVAALQDADRRRGV